MGGIKQANDAAAKAPRYKIKQRKQQRKTRRSFKIEVAYKNGIRRKT